MNNSSGQQQFFGRSEQAVRKTSTVENAKVWSLDGAPFSGKRSKDLVERCLVSSVGWLKSTDRLWLECVYRVVPGVSTCAG